MLTQSYATLAVRQVVREGPPAAPSPTLDQLRVEAAWKRRQRNALLRQIRRSKAFIREHRPPYRVVERIAAAVEQYLLQLADVVDDLEGVQAEIDRLETALFGWRGVPPHIVP